MEPARLIEDLPALPEHPSVSVIVCAFTEERLDNLRALLTNLPQQSYGSAEVVIVVDRNPALAETLRSGSRGVRVVENEGPQGQVGATNYGLTLTHGDVAVFIDDDALPVDDDWLTWLVGGYDAPNVLGVGGPVEPRWLAPRPSWFPGEFLWVVGASHTGSPTRRGPIRNLWGGNMSVRRSVLELAGGFRTSLSRVGKRPFAAQETEFCIRAAQRLPGGVFVHEPRARILHDVPAVRTTFGYFRTHCHDEAVAKVVMSRYVGSRDGLSSEREYMTRVLPAGVARGLGDALVRRDLAGLQRSAAILVGAAAAGWGYTRARFLLPDPTVNDEELHAVNDHA